MGIPVEKCAHVCWTGWWWKELKGLMILTNEECKSLATNLCYMLYEQNKTKNKTPQKQETSKVWSLSIICQRHCFAARVVKKKHRSRQLSSPKMLLLWNHKLKEFAEYEQQCLMVSTGCVPFAVSTWVTWLFEFAESLKEFWFTTWSRSGTSEISVSIPLSLASVTDLLWWVQRFQKACGLLLGLATRIKMAARCNAKQNKKGIRIKVSFPAKSINFINFWRRSHDYNIS